MLRYHIVYQGRLLGNFGTLSAARKRCLALRKANPTWAPINIHIKKAKNAN